jgi:hypothetical protein
MVCENKKFYAIGIADPGTGSSGGFFFTRKELHEVVENSLIIEVPVWLEHGNGSPEIIGKVRYAWVDKKNGLMVMMEFDYTTLMSNVVLEWIRIGLFAGISLGYKSDVEYTGGIMNVIRKTINEVSIVRDPFHKTCRIHFVGTKIPENTSTGIVKKSKDISASELFPYF